MIRSLRQGHSDGLDNPLDLFRLEVLAQRLLARYVCPSIAPTQVIDIVPVRRDGQQFLN